jgi:hypothetical protein
MSIDVADAVMCQLRRSTALRLIALPIPREEKYMSSKVNIAAAAAFFCWVRRMIRGIGPKGVRRDRSAPASQASMVAAGNLASAEVADATWRLWQYAGRG